MKYMVMECHPGYAVVLDEDGHFLKVANLRYEPGQMVTDVIEMQAPQDRQKKKKRHSWMYSLPALAACFALMAVYGLQENRTIYASVHMSINPDVQIDVNRKDEVIDLTGENPEGEELIEGYEYKKKDLDLVVDDLVDRAIDLGYLQDGGQISLALDAENDEWIVVHSDSLGTHLGEHLGSRLSVTIDINGEVKQSGTVTIPANPGTESYTEEDYETGEDSSGTPAPAEPSSSGQTSAQPAPTPTGDSGYDDGQTDYGDTAAPAGGQSGSGNSGTQAGSQGSAGANSGGQSDYDDQEDGQSEYHTSDDGDGQSGYDSSDDDDDNNDD